MSAGSPNAGRRLAATLGRAAVAACCLPVFWAAFDQILLAQVAFGQAPASVPQDDDDDMAQLTAPVRQDRPAACAPRTAVPNTSLKPVTRARTDGSPPHPPRCERDRRNGFGAPLLC